MSNSCYQIYPVKPRKDQVVYFTHPLIRGDESQPTEYLLSELPPHIRKGILRAVDRGCLSVDSSGRIKGTHLLHLFLASIDRARRMNPEIF